LIVTVETTYSQAREQMKTLMDRAVNDREVILVRRRTGDAVAMIAADELQSLTETAHLLRSPKNAERLLTALQRARTHDRAPTPVAQLARDVGFEP
jgi:antitoxin YefM